MRACLTNQIILFCIDVIIYPFSILRGGLAYPCLWKKRPVRVYLRLGHNYCIWRVLLRCVLSNPHLNFNSGSAKLLQTPDCFISERQQSLNSWRDMTQHLIQKVSNPNSWYCVAIYSSIPDFLTNLIKVLHVSLQSAILLFLVKVKTFSCLILVCNIRL